MKLKKPCAGVIAVLALALSLMLVPQVGSAAGNGRRRWMRLARTFQSQGRLTARPGPGPDRRAFVRASSVTAARP